MTSIATTHETSSGHSEFDGLLDAVCLSVASSRFLSTSVSEYDSLRMSIEQSVRPNGLLAMITRSLGGRARPSDEPASAVTLSRAS